MKRWQTVVLYLIFLMAFGFFNPEFRRAIEGTIVSRYLYLSYFAIMFAPPLALTLISNSAADYTLITFNTIVASFLTPVFGRESFLICLIGISGPSVGAVYFRSLQTVHGNDHLCCYANFKEFERDLFNLQRMFFPCIAVLLTFTVSIIAFDNNSAVEFKYFLIPGVMIFASRMLYQHKTMKYKYLEEQTWFET